eukprot:9835821-Lingulodinium_polyedra.AAC.1
MRSSFHAGLKICAESAVGRKSGRAQTALAGMVGADVLVESCAGRVCPSKDDSLVTLLFCALWPIYDNGIEVVGFPRKSPPEVGARDALSRRLTLHTQPTLALRLFSCLLQTMLEHDGRAPRRRHTFLAGMVCVQANDSRLAGGQPPA